MVILIAPFRAGCCDMLRDKAFTLLDRIDSPIREYGRYVFWKDEDKRTAILNS